VDQSAGWGYKLAAQHLKAEFKRSGLVTMLLLRYTQALITHKRHRQLFATGTIALITRVRHQIAKLPHF